jgi:hypothetical protein
MVPMLYVAPGLSAVTEPALAPGALGTARYRRWTDRLRLLTEAQPAASPPSAAGRSGSRRRIRFTSPASGTLPRLP